MPKKINLEEFVNEMPFACSQYRTKVKNEMLEFGKQLLELAAENAKMKLLIDEENDIVEEATIDKGSIINTIKQVK